MNSKPYLDEIDVAAGGLLTCGEDDGLRVCVVLRPRHADLTLPKGHPQAGETLAQAAQREVREETGCTAAIESIVDPISYLVGETPKLVVFFRMSLASHGAPSDPEEVAEVLWLPPREACKRLTYPEERALVERILC